MTTESFPRQRARTRNFTLGAPRAFRISPDGERVTFLRTKGGGDPVTCLWELTVSTGTERLVADPVALGADDENLPPAERARRERVRETGSGIVSYATDSKHSLAVFPLSGQVYVADLGQPGTQPRRVPAAVPALDPRPDPAGTKIGYIHDGAFRVIDLESGQDRVIASEDGVTFGLAEFVAAEEMGRLRGYWWSPDGNRVLLARVDEGPVNTWHIADPANPDREPVAWKYPAAGTPNAEVTLFIADLAAGPGVSASELAPVPRDAARFPYFAAADWSRDLLLVTQTRDQKTTRLTRALTGDVPAETVPVETVLLEDTDEHWTDIVPGTPAQLPGGTVAWTRVSDDTRRLVIAAPGELATAEPVTPPGLQVRGILSTDGDTVIFSASREATEVGVWRYGPEQGLEEVATSPGVHSVIGRGGTTVTVSRSLDRAASTVRASTGAASAAGSNDDHLITSLAEEPSLPLPAPRFLEAGPDAIRTAVLFPSWHTPGDGKLPVLMAPYGGPHHQEVLKAGGVYLQNQWFAEQGFAVVMADGHGTPGRGPAWERAIAGDFATRVLDDQVTALGAAATEFGDLDVSRVGIRGWSFGGYLSALAVLRRPDVFHAAVAGAPVTDWRLYDTHYTERYLGDPVANRAAYEASSLLIAERPVAAVHRPLLLVHGLADDNVLVAHTLRLSSALLAAGYPHSVLPLSGVTHMTPQETVAENLLLLQVSFLRSALGATVS
ncbi:MAG TPA: prolyl oligopeptidase family serine peptidase [Trebonia sp.]